MINKFIFVLLLTVLGSPRCAHANIPKSWQTHPSTSSLLTLLHYTLEDTSLNTNENFKCLPHFECDILKTPSAIFSQINDAMLKDSTYTSLLLKGSGAIENRKDYNVDEMREIIKHFEANGGTVLFVPDDTTFHFQIKLPQSCTMYPICKGGINRSQILYRVLMQLQTADMQIQNPHGANLGFEKEHVDLLPEEIEMIGSNSSTGKYRSLAYNLYSAAFDAPRLPRWGLHLNLNSNQLAGTTAISTTEQTRKKFAEQYWGNNNSSRPRMYIAFQSAAFAPLLRANPKNAYVIVLSMSDEAYRVEKQEPYPTKQTYIASYHKMFKSLQNIFTI